MSAPLDEQYFTWLYSQVASLKTKSLNKTYFTLLNQLYRKEFFWFVPNDDNRVEDGRYLRPEFLASANIDDPDEEWLYLGCSMLEMLIGLSRRFKFEAGGLTSKWFWHLMENINLAEFTDANPGTVYEIDEVLNTIIWRQYKADGTGGLFPLDNPKDDQRKVELWYQLNAYINEQNYR